MHLSHDSGVDRRVVDHFAGPNVKLLSTFRWVWVLPSSCETKMEDVGTRMQTSEIPISVRMIRRYRKTNPALVTGDFSVACI